MCAWAGSQDDWGEGVVSQSVFDLKLNVYVCVCVRERARKREGGAVS